MGLERKEKKNSYEYRLLLLSKIMYGKLGNNKNRHIANGYRKNIWHYGVSIGGIRYTNASASRKP